MFDWLKLALLLLQFANKIIDAHQAQLLRDEGARNEIAKTIAEVLRKAGFAKSVVEDIGRLTPAELDDGLRELEPGSGPGKAGSN